jgi:hypothetical protein
VIVDIIDDCNYFDDEGYVTEDGLALGQCFWSKDHLKWVVHDFYIKANRTFKKKSQIKVCIRSNAPTKIVIGGYASRRQSDYAFIINTRQGPLEWLL